MYMQGYKTLVTVMPAVLVNRSERESERERDFIHAYNKTCNTDSESKVGM